MPFQEYSSLAIVRCQFFIDGRVCNVRADNGSLVSLKFLFGFVNQRISLSLQLLADRNHVYVGSVIPKHYPHRIHLVFIPTQPCPALASKTVAIMTSQERRRRVRIEQRRSRLRLLAEVKENEDQDVNQIPDTSSCSEQIVGTHPQYYNRELNLGCIL